MSEPRVLGCVVGFMLAGCSAPGFDEARGGGLRKGPEAGPGRLELSWSGKAATLSGSYVLLGSRSALRLLFSTPDDGSAVDVPITLTSLSGNALSAVQAEGVALGVYRFGIGDLGSGTLGEATVQLGGAAEGLHFTSNGVSYRADEATSFAIEGKGAVELSCQNTEGAFVSLEDWPALPNCGALHQFATQ
jgi:hypothetical protein